jgi:hypothetical protein
VATVVLVAVICDRPAASKAGGFASYSHRMFCARDMVPEKDLRIAKCFEKDGEELIEIGIMGPNMIHL